VYIPVVVSTNERSNIGVELKQFKTEALQALHQVLIGFGDLNKRALDRVIYTAKSRLAKLASAAVVSSAV
jgi:hypothetical protein